MPYLIFLILYAVCAGLNLVGAIKSRILSAVTKPLLMPLLCLYCIFRGTPSPDCLLVAALAACWLGDVLLMMGSNVWFTAGGVSFFSGHVLLIIVFAHRVGLDALPLCALIPAALIYAGAAVYVMNKARKNAPKLMQLPMLLYLVANAVTNLFALAFLFAAPGAWSAAAYCGALLFFLSDCALYLTRYDPEPKRFYRSGFFIMLTYTSGVMLIVAGLIPPFN